MIDKLINKYLTKQNFIKVPMSWAEDYKNLFEKHQGLNKIIRTVASEYNFLLREYAECQSVKWLKEALEEVGAIIPIGNSKEDLIDCYVETFKVEFAEDKEETLSN